MMSCNHCTNKKKENKIFICKKKIINFEWVSCPWLLVLGIAPIVCSSGLVFSQSQHNDVEDPMGICIKEKYIYFCCIERSRKTPRSSRLRETILALMKVINRRGFRPLKGHLYTYHHSLVLQLKRKCEGAGRKGQRR